MINDNDVIETLDELETFLRLVETGGLGLENVTGVALATNNSDGRPFIAVRRYVTSEVYENGKDMVRYGTKKPH